MARLLGPSVARRHTERPEQLPCRGCRAKPGTTGRRPCADEHARRTWRRIRRTAPATQRLAIPARRTRVVRPTPPLGLIPAPPPGRPRIPRQHVTDPPPPNDLHTPSN